VEIEETVECIEISGLRGFSVRQRLDLAVPNGQVGSGLTIIVGQNNSGKSTIVEAFSAIAGRNELVRHYSESKRNKIAGDKINITVTFSSGNQRSLKTVESGGSEARIVNTDSKGDLDILVLPSRRFFQPFFVLAPLARNDYARNLASDIQRNGPVDYFTGRLPNIQTHNKTEFNAVLSKLIEPFPEFIIEQADTGMRYLKIKLSGNQSHSSEGLGDGIISLMYIADALYDSPVASLLVIDEPELSLHPALLRRLSRLLADYAKDRQIVLATHSPYFADLSYIAAGARLARVYADESGCKISSLSPSTGEALKGILANKNVPHIFGLDAREIFFQDDGVILVEGQEDVVRYPLIAKELGTEFKGKFFGWGVGGFGNFKVCAQILSELGFSCVVGIVDGDHPEVASELMNQFPKFKFFVIPAPDIRTKEETPAKAGKEGLLDLDGKLHARFKSEISQLISEVNAYIEPKNGQGE